MTHSAAKPEAADSSVELVEELSLRGTHGTTAFIASEHIAVGKGLYRSISQSVGEPLSAVAIGRKAPSTAQIYRICEPMSSYSLFGAFESRVDRILDPSQFHQLMLGISADRALRDRMKGQVLVAWLSMRGATTLVEAWLGFGEGGADLDRCSCEELPAGVLTAVIKP